MRDLPKPVIFLAFANDLDPSGQYLRNLGAEARQLRSCLEKAEKNNLCEIVERQSAKSEEILRVFREYKDRIAVFHYAGHAKDDNLLLATDKAQSTLADGRGLAAFLRGQVGLQLVFLNACSTRAQAKALNEAGVAVVIATARAVNDELATAFSSHFYENLASGESIAAAFTKAQAATQFTASDLMRNLQPVEELQHEHAADGFPWAQYIRAGAELALEWNLPEAADDPLFGLPQLPKLDLPKTPYRHLEWFRREDAELFFGRSHEIAQLYRKVLAPDGHPIILFYGQSGVGKSSVLAAGLLPRLAQTHRVAYIHTRSDQTKDLTAILAAVLGAGNSSNLLDTWRKNEADANAQPLTIILDQVEEIFTQPISGSPVEMENLLNVLTSVFANRDLRPRGRLILGFRKEWLAEIEKQLTNRKLPHSKVFLERLRPKGIVEIITGPARVSRLRNFYNLTLDDDLPSLITGHLLLDQGSPVAPMLQILLTEMWTAATAKNYDHPHLDHTLYHQLRAKGLGLDDFLERQLQVLQEMQPELVESGLALDLLSFHTTPLGTADQHAMKAVEKKYLHQKPVVRALVQACRDLYLLVDPAANQPKEAPASRLTHDTLAPHVRKRFDESDAPGQRARRILESRLMTGSNSKERAREEKLDPLGDADLTIVEAGRIGMRAWAEQEQQLVEISRTDRARRLQEQEQIEREREEARAREVQHAKELAEEQRLRAEEQSKLAEEQRLRAEEQSKLADAEREQAQLEHDRAEEQKSFASKLRYALIVSMTIGTLAVVAALVAFWQFTRANAQTKIATEAAQNALTEESHLLANQSQQQYQVDPIASTYLAFHALPNAENDRPYVAEAEFALAQSVRGIQETSYLTLTGQPFGLDQFAMAENTLAIDGDDLYLVDISESLTVASVISTSVDPFAVKRGIDWGPNGLLLQFDSNQGIRLFDTKQCDASCVELPKPQTSPIDGAVGCTEWHPTEERIAVCASSLQLLSTDWTTQEVDSLSAADVAWSPEGDRLAAWGDDWVTGSKKLLVWDGTNTITASLDVTNSIYADLLWLDNEYLLTIHEKGIFIRSIQQWDAPTYIDATALQGTARVHNGALSPDGRFLLTFLDNGVGQFWQVETDEQAEIMLTYAGELSGHTKAILSAAWHNDYLATTGMDGTIRIWQLTTGDTLVITPISTLYGYPGTTFDDRADVFGAKWLDNQENQSDRSLKLLTYGEDGSLRIWQVFDRQGSPICTGVDADGIPQCIDENSKYESAQTAATQRKITHMRTLDSGILITAGSDGSAGFASSPPERSLTILSSPMVMQTQVLSTYQTYGVVWNEQGTRVLTYLVHDEELESLVKDPYTDGMVRSVNADGTVAHTVTIPGPIISAIWLGDKLLVNEESDTVRLVNADTSESNPLPELSSRVVAARPSQNYVAMLTQSGQLTIWKADFSTILFTGITGQVVGDPSPTCNLLAWSNDGTKLLTGGSQVVVWEIPIQNEMPAPVQSSTPSMLQGQPLDSVIGLGDQMNCVWFSPNDIDAAITRESRFFVVNAESGQLLWENADHDEQINGMEWVTGATWPNPSQLTDPVRHLLLTWSVDGTARLWDVAQRTEIMRMSYQESPSTSSTPNAITAAAVSKDGNHILTATSAFVPEQGETGIVRSWHSWHKNPECLLQKAKTRITRPLTAVQLSLLGLSPNDNQLPQINVECR